MNKDHIKGATNEVTGEIKERVGRMTGDKSLEVKGHARELKGKLQQRVGDAKDDIREERELDREIDKKDLDR
ncbi:CsbD family protein [Ramlibacter sp. USB13]|uniref:CsbD family protein n=1 Tax=Ramlibacter cellulosilyticus TaxID=2764187 RepID=A0A923MQ30_9BURK|nr:CsbD family protein [Ramlibacter cellulosilyticus]MBC5783143.1 CsbD family protein [Ramlibacter cellulosilyticus]